MARITMQPQAPRELRRASLAVLLAQARAAEEKRTGTARHLARNNVPTMAGSHLARSFA